MNLTDTAMANWEDKEDIIEPEGGLDDTDLTTGEEDFNLSGGESPNEADDEAPTTETESETADQGEGTQGAPTTEQQELSMPTTLKFKAKIDHDEMDVSLDSGDLPTIFQKATNHDRMSKRYGEMDSRVKELNAQAVALGFTSIDEMVKSAKDATRTRQIEELIEGGTAKDVAEFVVDRKMSERQSASMPKIEDPHTEENQFARQVADLYAARPDLKGTLKRLPDEVTRDVLENNKPLLVAYLEWESKAVKAENVRLKNERNAFERQADAASRSPVRGTTTTGAPNTGKQDPWLIGFGDDY